MLTNRKFSAQHFRDGGVQSDNRERSPGFAQLRALGTVLLVPALASVVSFLRIYTTATGAGQIYDSTDLDSQYITQSVVLIFRHCYFNAATKKMSKE